MPVLRLPHCRRPRRAHRTVREAWEGFFDDPLLLDDECEPADAAAGTPARAEELVPAA